MSIIELIALGLLVALVAMTGLRLWKERRTRQQADIDVRAQRGGGNGEER